MIAKDILSLSKPAADSYPPSKVDSEMPLFDLIPKLLDSGSHELTVVEDGEPIGIIDETSLLAGIGRMIAPRDDCSVITVECGPEDYCASAIAHAIEDSDAHLVDLLSAPADNGRMSVTLRVRHSDPTAAVRSLERYGYHVVEAHSSGDHFQTMEIATERLLSLQVLMNV
ncbi:MAG: hypothetical protein J1D77_08110 [Muribaculaceae bacterium]|nr:hypothetical protein [Muribaculaceae bacterium]